MQTYTHTFVHKASEINENQTAVFDGNRKVYHPSTIKAPCSVNKIFKWFCDENVWVFHTFETGTNMAPHIFLHQTILFSYTKWIIWQIKSTTNVCILTYNIVATLSHHRNLRKDRVIVNDTDSFNIWHQKLHNLKNT